MARQPEIGNIQLYPDRPLQQGDKNGYVLKYYCPLHQKRIRKNCGTRDRRDARRILRECRERLLNGQYIESGGIITDELEIQHCVPIHPAKNNESEYLSDRRWQDCFEHYYDHQKKRLREKSLSNAASRIQIAERILEKQRTQAKLPTNANIQEYTTLACLENLQDQLLAGDESQYKRRSPTTVNTMMGAILAFVRYCHRHGWIEQVPPLTKLSVDDVMKGRPISEEEFQTMLNAVPDVVGEPATESWKNVLQVIWVSAFRIGEVMNFSWNDDQKIHPVWPHRDELHPTIIVPSTQKNGKSQEIPMLPGLQKILETTPQENRTGWIVNPQPIIYQIKTHTEHFKPTKTALKKLAAQYNNSAIARACKVSETTIRKWLHKANIQRPQEFNRRQGEITPEIIQTLRNQTEIKSIQQAQRNTQKRLSTEHVSRIIAKIGQQANIITQHPNKQTARRQKHATAHDLRRSCAHRLINAGVSAETLKVILRHKDFTTTEKFYAATKAAQSAASEIHKKLTETNPVAENNQLSPKELQKLKTLLRGL